MEVVAEADSLYEEALTSILANSPLVIYWFVSLLVTIPLKVTTFFSSQSYWTPPQKMELPQ